MKLCNANGCERQRKNGGNNEYCSMHYKRIKRNGDPYTMKRRAKGQGWINEEGYIVLKVDKKLWLAHRYIWEQYYGRKLLKEETIHHKNGNRSDNRIENLELWSMKQPYGQRVEDKVKWAKEILAQYDVNIEDEEWRLP
jgi:hypothetical protein